MGIFGTYEEEGARESIWKTEKRWHELWEKENLLRKLSEAKRHERENKADRL